MHDNKKHKTPNALRDVIIAITIIIAFFPIFLAICIAVFIDDWGAVFFTQERIGARGHRFKIIKFRTMRKEACTTDPPWTEVNDSRITRVGHILRKYHLDEIPQLFNVLRGEMALVGPRPEQPDLVSVYLQCIPGYDIRHNVMPGITGLAQVRLPYCVGIEETRKKLKYDLYYIRHASHRLDAYIVLLTIKAIILEKRYGR